jgi:hypothetical protein
MLVARIAGLIGAVALSWCRPALGQGLELSLTTGVSGELAEFSGQQPDLGLLLELQPQWRFGSGLSLGVGFRYTAYASVPDRESIYLDLRFIGRRPGVRPVMGLRAGGFHGGDTEGDDPYIGLEIGPVGGVEVPLRERADLQLLGSAYGVLGLFRGFRVLPGVQVGLVVR